MRVLLIRHGMTQGNLEKRYVGNTDEPLTVSCAEELRLAFERGKTLALCRPEYLRSLYVSPMKRCLMTADLLFPRETYSGARREMKADLRECGFGLFEYKNYLELSGDGAYQHFIDTMGKDGFPGGESLEKFKTRCIREFVKILETEFKAGSSGMEDDGQTLVFVVHGGTIMSVLEAFAVPHQEYYSWQVKNAEGFTANVHKCKNGDFYLTDVAKVRIL